MFVECAHSLNRDSVGNHNNLLGNEIKRSVQLNLATESQNQAG